MTQLADGRGASARTWRGGACDTRGEDAPDALDGGRARAGRGRRGAGAGRAEAGATIGERDVVVAASGNLANVYFTTSPEPR